MSASDESAPPQFSMPGQTLVQERDGNNLLSFDGLLVLPIGAQINLDNLPGLPQVPLDADRFPNGHADATVVAVRVFGTQGADPILVLEVELGGAGGNSPLVDAEESEVVEAAEQIAHSEDSEAAAEAGLKEPDS
jgi:hypothetical protein